MSNEKLKNTLVGVTCIATIVGVALWSFGVINFESTSESRLEIPDGYTHINSTENGSEVVHTYKKNPAQLSNVTQTSDQAYGRYMQGLPESLDKAIAQEFRTLSVSLQNARLFADTTGLIRQGRENMKTLGELEGEQQDQAKKQASRQNNTGLLVGADIQSEMDIPSSESKLSNTSLDDLTLEGVIGENNEFYAMIQASNGKSYSLKPGQRFDGKLVVVSVNTREVIISNGKHERVIPVM